MQLGSVQNRGPQTCSAKINEWWPKKLCGGKISEWRSFLPNDVGRTLHDTSCYQNNNRVLAGHMNQSLQPPRLRYNVSLWFLAYDVPVCNGEHYFRTWVWTTRCGNSVVIGCTTLWEDNLQCTFHGVHQSHETFTLHPDTSACTAWMGVQTGLFPVFIWWSRHGWPQFRGLKKKGLHLQLEARTSLL